MIIRHKNFLDICFEVSPTSKFQSGFWGRWVNMGYVSSWYLPCPSLLLVIKDRNEWEQCTTPYVKCLRYGTWVPL